MNPLLLSCCAFKFLTKLSRRLKLDFDVLAQDMSEEIIPCLPMEGEEMILVGDVAA